MRKLAIGDRVKLSREALKNFPTYKGRVGTVVGWARLPPAGAVIAWDDLKSRSAWSFGYLVPAPAAGGGKGT